jgi:hypothetical protein
MRKLKELCLLFLLCSSAGTTVAQSATPDGVTLLASDGNLYGISGVSGASGFFEYNQATRASTVLNSNFTEAYLCLERSTGDLLGFQLTGSGYELFTITLGGTLTPITSSLDVEPFCPALANDGNYYGPSNGGLYSHGFIYQLSPAGVMSDIYDFTGTTDGDVPYSPAVQASDGNLYFANGGLVRYSPTVGLTVFSANNDLSGPLLEAVDGNLYSLTDEGVTKVTLNDSGSVIYSSDDTYSLNALYVPGPTLALQTTASNGVTGGDCSLEFGLDVYMSPMDTSGDFTSGGFSLGSMDVDTDYSADLYLAGNGTFFGTLYSETEGSMPPGCTTYFTANTTLVPTTFQPISMSLNKDHVLPGGTATLTWKVNNAYSDTMQQCYGFGGLSGKLALSGTATITAPISGGSQVTAIICGGTETSFVTLNAGNAVVKLAATTPVGVGSPTRLIATISNAGSDAPTGKVNFLYGSTVIGSATLVNGSATFTASTSGLAPGTYDIVASYVGDSNYGAAKSSSVAITLVPKTATSVAVTPTSQTLTGGNSATFVATVTGSSSYGFPTGTVTLLYNGSTLLTSDLSGATSTTSDAKLTASTTGIPPGTYSVKVSYSGDSLNNPSTSGPVTVTVLADDVTLTASPNPLPAGDSLVLTATVTGKDSPTGTVIFYANSSQIASHSLSSGVATVMLPTGTLAAGTYSLTAYYAGDTNNPSSTSAPLSLTVD